MMMMLMLMMDGTGWQAPHGRRDVPRMMHTPRTKMGDARLVSRMPRQYSTALSAPYVLASCEIPVLQAKYFRVRVLTCPLV
jgi:hypothetical protein